MDVRAYLARIDDDGPLVPCAETLCRLQHAHLGAVPFENLSIHVGEPIVLEEQALYEKIVLRRRGGFCYELNGLFAALLRALGFEVSMLSAGVAREEGGFGPEFDHMALLVELERRWLVDVGFGDSFLEPLLVDERGEQVQGGRAYRLEPEGERLVLLRRDPEAGWAAQYRFGLGPHVLADYAGMCRYHQTSPLSPFTRRRICSRALPEGRATLSEMRLVLTRGAERSERPVAGDAEYAALLSEHFGIVMGG